MSSKNILHKIRGQNLSWLEKNRASIKEIANLAGVNEIYLRQCLSGTSGMGVNVAGKIESALGLNEGWLSINRSSEYVAEKKAAYKTVSSVASIIEKSAKMSDDEIKEAIWQLANIIYLRNK